LDLFSSVPSFSAQYEQLAAAVLISVVPIVVVFLFFQRYFEARLFPAGK
jgi:ABC-type glycerol-3-phosphate transport system permease component